MTSSILSRRNILKITAASAGLYTFAQPARFNEILQIRCQGLEFLFDPTLGFVRQIKWNGIEVLNGIYAAVRDEVWGTVPPQVSNVIVETEADVFKISFEVICQQNGIDFYWTGSITGAPRALDFQFEGEARSGFKRNRIGICVLHPLKECAGKPVKIDKQNGEQEQGVFPDAISPHQPFQNIQRITHEVYPGLMAEVRFTGDTFEMEDHRNWTDGNFKTYCTPLALPYPVEIAKGTKITQSAQLRLVGTPKPLPPPYRKPSETVLGWPEQPQILKAPAVGFALAPDGPALTAKDARILKLTAPAHLRVDLQPGTAEASLDRAKAALDLLPGAALEAAVFLTSAGAEAELRAAAKGVAARNLKVARWMVFHADEAATSRKWVDLARRHLTGAPLGAGTNQYFTELNRNRPDMSAMDFAAYSINPQVHAFDNLSLVENLAPQAETLRSGAKFAAGKPLVVSPVTLRPRFNPQAKVQPVTKPGEPPARVDPRQPSLFAAAWTLGSMRYLAGAASVTYYETHGMAGMLDGSGAFPLLHPFAAVAGFDSWAPLWSSDEATILGFAVRKPSGDSKLLLANLTSEVQRLRFRELNRDIRVRLLDSETQAEAKSNPEGFHKGFDFQVTGRRKEISMLPYAIAILLPA